MKEIDGNLITLALEGNFDVIVHGCNCFCTMGAGIAPQMAKAFGCNEFPLELLTKEVYLGYDEWDEIDSGKKGDINKLGQIDYQEVAISKRKGHRIGGYSLPKSDDIILFTVVNAYTQYDYKGQKPLNYMALGLCFQKMNHVFKGKHIGMPRIGCGLAGGDWERVKTAIFVYFTDCKVTVVNYKP